MCVCKSCHRPVPYFLHRILNTETQTMKGTERYDKKKLFTIQNETVNKYILNQEKTTCRAKQLVHQYLKKNDSIQHHLVVVVSVLRYRLTVRREFPGNKETVIALYATGDWQDIETGGVSRLPGYIVIF